MKLSPNEKLDIEEVLKDLDQYRPKRKGWRWRKQVPEQSIGPFIYKESAEGLKNSIPLPAAHYFNDIDPQCEMVITTEIASGRFEDDLRRMRMAAWHGADHIMVIRTTGQSHINGLIEGTPEGVGGIPVTRKQIRATRKALDAIEEEVPAVLVADRLQGVGTTEAVYEGNVGEVRVNGHSHASPEVWNRGASRGSYFTDADVAASARVAVIGTNVVRDLFGDIEPIGM